MKKLRYLDYFIFIPYIILSVIGAVMVYSASSEVAVTQGKAAASYFEKQVIFVIIGLILLFFTFFFKYQMLKNKKIVLGLLIFIFVSLILVFFLAEEINGAKAWISIGGAFNFQPAEFAKLVLIWYLAFIFSRKQQSIVKDTLNTIWPPMVIFLLIAILVFLENDVGGALILTIIALAVMFSSGMPARLGVLSGLGASTFAGGYIYLVYKYGTKVPFMNETRLSRFQAFWDPFKTSQEAGLQLYNSYLALSRGGLFGVGLGRSVQKLGYLPEPYTDFIIAILGEELGLVTLLFVVLLIMMLISRIYLIGIRAKDSFGSLICVGVATMMMIQTFLNLGGVTGILPITGVTFPFISYGGSSMLVLSISLGLVLNISATEKMNKEIKS
ncbi:FtsW/RodA/SpoVE family cell cycle protein [Isobaculum melis]|uniref:Probable peptidoglycan glycosyltransferase FtsW n=1 Tax=Isobaculum melis TaxID=142588 RepID=A0A1H9RW54_9LACT|nr:FtsW/RodA/SpoVE family cell cycle protein [Isobaculum melis]SER76393.1 cell division-specific peptidoglycan biosynthesis regulator FtsW [Isobaculum melis]